MKTSIGTEKPSCFLVKLKAFAKKSETPSEQPEIEDGLVNEWMRNRLAGLKCEAWFLPKRTQEENNEIAFLEKELASGTHLVHAEDESWRIFFGLFWKGLILLKFILPIGAIACLMGWSIYHMFLR